MADGVQIDYSGVNRVANWLRGLASKLPDAVNEEAEEWGQQTVIELKMKPYPPQRAGSSYQRTFEMRKRWKLEKHSAGQFSIVNIARQRGRLYAQYVVGDAQASIHQGRWWHVRKVVERLFPRLRKRIASRIDRETR